MHNRSHRFATIFVSKGKSANCSPHRGKAEDDNLSVARFPMARVDPEPADSFVAHMTPLVQETEEILCFVPREKWAVEELVHPIHLAIVGQVKGDIVASEARPSESSGRQPAQFLSCARNNTS